MPPTPHTQRGIDPATATTPMPEVDVTTPHLSTRTLDWQDHRPRDRDLVRSVWDTLTELERAGQQPGPIAALRRVLTHHQPTPAGRCHTCRRAWRRRSFPCIVWHQIRGELLGLFADGHHRDTSSSTDSPTPAAR
ncbi:MAG: hypothetical protein ACRDUV_08480 [Pseudonocardiaceae bacterium]